MGPPHPGPPARSTLSQKTTEDSATPLPAQYATTHAARRDAGVGESAPSESYDTPESPRIGQDVDHFRILRELGRGGMGQVLLARDMRLGRLVALKLIRSDRLTRPNAVGDLMEEAKVTARLSHPNIVTIHHVGLWHRSPYMALEYVESESLRNRLSARPMPSREVLRVALPIARALQAAHAARVIHCDLKPENVLVPRDGRLRVVDFGIAAVVEAFDASSDAARGALFAGTPAYMAPERFSGAHPAPAVDIYSLGVLVYEMLVGHRPFEGPDQDERPIHLRVLDEQTTVPPPPGADPELQSLVMAMIEHEPDLRPTATEAAKRLEALLARPALDGRVETLPFRGLLPFEEQHAEFFFGRDADIDALAEQLRRATVVPVVGSSGTGKSSMVQAGVIPRLREQGLWTVIALRPGPRPLQMLANRLLQQGNEPSGGAVEGRSGELSTSSPVQHLPSRKEVQQLADEILETPSRVNVMVHRLAEESASRVLLFVDQLEEIATHGCPPDEAQAFLDAVAGAADPVDGLVRVLFTVRDDFLGRLATGRAMRLALPHVVVLRRLDAQTLHEAVSRPLERVGHFWDAPEVVDEMVAELQGEPAALPMLQFACAALWERRDKVARQLRKADYEAIGGVTGALAAHAEAVLDGLESSELQIARDLLLRLVAPEGTRRSVERGELLAGLGAGAEAVLERLTAARLLTSRRTREGQERRSVLELAHESLVRTWPQLARWLEQDSDQRLAVAEVEAAGRLWVKRGSGPDEVWPLQGVADMRRRLGGHQERLTVDARAFLDAGDAKGRRSRRVRATLLGGLALVLAAVTVGSLLVAAELSQRERVTRNQAAEITLAAGDMGLTRLALEVHDWAAPADSPTAVDPSTLPDLRWTLWEPDPADPRRPLRPRDGRFVKVSDSRIEDGRLVAQVETRSGPAFLVIDGRGGQGRTCPPSQLRLRGLPGYATRADGAVTVAIAVPTCRASLNNAVTVPAGPFIYGGVGTPAFPGHIQPSKERSVDLPVFRINRTEASNADYARYARNAAATGVNMPDYPADNMVRGAARPDHPATAVDAYTAEAFCAWHGMRLPSTEEWSKAARGGAHLDAAKKRANPMPKRNLPWGKGALASRMNLADTDDVWQHSAPVAALPAGASPYGVLGMAGNVAEWTSSRDRGSPGRSLRLIRGGDWDTRVSDGLFAISVANARHPRFFSFSLGVRCAL